MIRHAKDVQFELPNGSVKLQGIIDEKIRLVMEGTLKTIDMYALADYFRDTLDMFATGEFWGKLMRASCLICGYTGDEKLRSIVDEAARDMLAIQQPDGCISACPRETQPKGTNGSDLWERKYVLMGLLAYYELCKSQEALEAAVKLVRYTNEQVGKAPKTPITETGWAFCGIESSSILEPVMRIWHITKDPSAMELGKYIVESGCCSRENIFQAIRDGKSPVDVGSNGVPKESIAKAYEMMSCFEGLAEYYRATGEEEALKTLQLFWDKVWEEEITLLGAGGGNVPYNQGPGNGEQWNRTRYEQTNPDMEFMMETCVTVYWMRLCEQMLRITGDPKYMDELEKSLYNAILGALRPDGRFFEYFPKFNGTRNPKVNYSFNIKGFDLSCCTANGPTALGMAPMLAFMGTSKGVAVNLYENSQVNICHEGAVLTLKMVSEYPRRGKISLRVEKLEGELPEGFTIALRVPGFADHFRVVSSKSGSRECFGKPGTYVKFIHQKKDAFQVGEEWDIQFDIPLIKHRAPHGSNRAGDPFVAFTYGSLLLARDQRDGVMPLTPIADKEVESYRIEPSRYGGYVTVYLQTGGEEITLIDYMSAGNDWNGGSFASWLPIR